MITTTKRTEIHIFEDGTRGIGKVFVDRLGEPWFAPHKEIAHLNQDHLHQILSIMHNFRKHE